MPTVLVTGGAGFIGANLVKRLLKLKHKVVVIDDLSTGFRHNLPLPNKNLVFYEKNINENLRPILRKHKIDYIFHLAAQMDVRKSLQKPIYDAKVNILGSLNIIREAARIKIKKFIYASSGGAVYGEPREIPVPESHSVNPLSCYGISKYTAEKYLETYHRLYKLPYITLRYANVYGPRQNPLGEAGVIAILLHQLIQGEAPSLFAYGKNKRDYIFVEDIVEANIKAMLSCQNKIYNIGTGKATTTEQIFQIVARELQSKIKPQYLPCRLGEVDQISLDASLAQKELKWRPRYSLEEGIRKTIEWFKSNQRPSQ
ncbi:MAG: NAD-dependent epimerase/dehydratase family protein [Candidatus Doudnabacteria bacterium]